MLEYWNFNYRVVIEELWLVSGAENAWNYVQ